MTLFMGDVDGVFAFGILCLLALHFSQLNVFYFLQVYNYEQTLNDLSDQLATFHTDLKQVRGEVGHLKMEC